MREDPRALCVGRAVRADQREWRRARVEQPECGEQQQHWHVFEGVVGDVVEGEQGQCVEGNSEGLAALSEATCYSKRISMSALPKAGTSEDAGCVLATVKPTAWSPRCTCASAASVQPC